MNPRMILKAVWGWTKRNSTKLLAAGAITAEAIGFYFMYKEAPIVRDRLDSLPESANWKDKIRVAGPVYLPAIGMLLLSAGCIIGGCAAGERKAAIMASLYSASEASLRRLEQKVIEEVGPEKARELHDQATEQLAQENPPEPSNIKNTGKGTKLFFERKTGQWFLSSYAAVKNDEATFNQHLSSSIWADLNEWLDCLGIERAELGDFFGFNLDSRLKIRITDGHRTTDGEQYYIIEYLSGPEYGPCLFNGMNPIPFYRCEDCYPDDE